VLFAAGATVRQLSSTRSARTPRRCSVAIVLARVLGFNSSAGDSKKVAWVEEAEATAASPPAEREKRARTQTSLRRRDMDLLPCGLGVGGRGPGPPGGMAARRQLRAKTPRRPAWLRCEPLRSRRVGVCAARSQPGRRSGPLPRCTLCLPGDVAEWLRSGLQSRLHRFDSGRRLEARDCHSHGPRPAGPARSASGRRTRSPCRAPGERHMDGGAGLAPGPSSTANRSVNLASNCRQQICATTVPVPT
jgi:hypothetical protein